MTTVQAQTDAPDAVGVRPLNLGARIVSSTSTLLLHALVLIAVTGAIQIEVPQAVSPVGVQLIGSVEPMTVTALTVAIPDSELILQVPSAATIELPVLPPPPIVPITTGSFETGREADWADAAEFARLQGLYVGQIHGRIHRALQTLASAFAITAPCTAKVVQDQRGRVLDVDLAECTLPDAQQQVLQSALRRASPLPRPPHGLAMGSYLSIDLSNLTQ